MIKYVEIREFGYNLQRIVIEIFKEKPQTIEAG